jgi:integrase
LVTPGRQTFDTAADEFIARKALTRREVTVTSYKAALTHPREDFGTKRLADVTPTDIERTVAKLVKLGRSKRTAELMLHVVRAIFKDAVKAKTIASNPAEDVEPRGVDAKERAGLSAADVAKLRKYLASDRLYACWLLTLLGLRRSEVLGLRWSDIDLTAKTLTISRGRVLADGRAKTVEGKTKTMRGVRTLPLLPDLLAALRKLRDSQLAEFGATQIREGLIALDEAGEPIRPERYSDLWREACKAAGVPVVTLHGARHSAVTTMRDAGVPDHIVAKFAGHDEVVMRRVYSHADAEGLETAAKALSTAYGATDSG